jgi:hypothetical protein
MSPVDRLNRLEASSALGRFAAQAGEQRGALIYTFKSPRLAITNRAAPLWTIRN